MFSKCILHYKETIYGDNLIQQSNVTLISLSEEKLSSLENDKGRKGEKGGILVIKKKFLVATP